MSIFQRQIELLEQVISISDQTASPYRQANLENQTRYFAIKMLERLRMRSVSMIPLLKGFPENMDTEYGMGLLLRNQASDMLSVLYVYDLLIHKEHDELDKFLKNLLNDGLTSTRSYLKSVNEHFSHKFPSDEAERIIEELNEKISQFSKEPIKGIYDKLLTLKRDIEADDIQRRDLAHQAYDTYMLFSKLEHFSFESSKLEEMPLHKKIISLQIKIYFTVYLNDMLHKLICLENENEVNLECHERAYNFFQDTLKDFDGKGTGIEA